MNRIVIEFIYSFQTLFAIRDSILYGTTSVSYSYTNQSMTTRLESLYAFKVPTENVSQIQPKNRIDQSNIKRNLRLI